MDNWQSTEVEKFLRGGGKEALMLRLSEQAGELGFEYFAFGVRTPLPVTRPRVQIHCNYPSEWQQRYAENEYHACDPSIPKALHSGLPIVWSDSLFARSPRLWAEARDFNLRVGLAQGHIDGQGLQSLLTLARSQDSITAAEVRSKAPRLQWLAQLARLAHRGLPHEPAGALLAEARVKLAEREVDVLRWTADGKTSADIAEILRISERTVNFHLSNAAAKLGAANKTAASVKAALLGLIW